MHAASVNPEPGSNSRNHGILTPGEGRLKSISSLIAHLLFFRVVFSLSEFTRCSSHILHTCVCPLLHTYLLLFNFQGPFTATFARRLFDYITSQGLCQGFFETFLRFCDMLRFAELFYFTILSEICQELFWSFFLFGQAAMLVCPFPPFLYIVA